MEHKSTTPAAQPVQPAPYAAGTGSAPLLNREAEFACMSYRERLALKQRPRYLPPPAGKVSGTNRLAADRRKVIRRGAVCACMLYKAKRQNLNFSIS